MNRGAEGKAFKISKLLSVSQAETQTTHFQQPKERKLRGCSVLSLAQAEIILRGISFALGFTGALLTETHALRSINLRNPASSHSTRSRSVPETQERGTPFLV